MGSNTFGTVFKITTWGESHGTAIGVVLDGCPAGIEIDEEEINAILALRAPGNHPFTSPRKEDDYVKILSGVFEGRTTGAPISLQIQNKDADSSKYEPIKDLYRPGHANYTYLEKYGVFDYRGGGRASARETACRVAAGAIAKKFLKAYGIEVKAHIKQIGHAIDPGEIHALLEKTKAEGDSVGGVVEFTVMGAPAGLGDPVYEKLEARLGYAMMSLPASKGFEIGSGFSAASMKGSEHNDCFLQDSGKISTDSNYAGGVLGGISTGMPIVGSVAFKPASSIKKPMKTVDKEGNESVFELPEGSRHDPCVAIRAVPVVEAMAALVLADAVLRNRSAK